MATARRGALFAIAIALLAEAATVAAAAGATAASASAPAVATPASSSASAAAVAPIEFAGVFEPGKTYVGDLFYDPNALRTWRPVKDVKVAADTSWTVRWKNLDRFAVLKTAAARARPQRVVFRVVSADTESGAPKQPWVTTYQGELLSVQSPATTGKDAARRR